ncbi:mismatch repair ATPase MSH2 [Ascoidea rubescens DSM 1968]|uniref:DNA mismatch repair protein MSH2 n=1 Tax=Ascoidea rubescens DSM 1968 TaxID=1344418 RepID=A0A1D2VIP1_9ASCO|nr:DNA mismatch repair protein [Ascoidea rubescens DSM 1968]ODV61420.1 DNA mismatch repair protein [Ascoidea rubescens DSM 1968]
MSSSRPELRFSDTADERSFYRKFDNLSPKPTNTLRLVDKGDYYILFHLDAELVAETIFKTNSVLKTRQESHYLTISPQIFVNLVKVFTLEKGYKLEIYDRNLKLAKTVSPGNLESIEDLIYNNNSNVNNITSGQENSINNSSLNSYLLNSNQIIIALKLVSKNDGLYIGLSFVDSNLKIIGICEFIDNDLFSNLESLLIQLSVKECLIPTVATDSNNSINPYNKLLQVLNRADISTTEIKPNQFNNDDIESDLSKLLTSNHSLSLSTTSILSNQLSLSSTTSLINYLNLLSDDSNYNTYDFKVHTLNQYMKLDLSAIKALNLFPTSRDQATKNSNIFSLLDRCKTNEGKRLLSQWIKQPLTDLPQITSRHLLTGFLISDSSLRDSLRDDILFSVPDIRRLTRKLLKKFAKLEDIITLYQVVLKLPLLIDLLNQSLDNIKDIKDTFEFIQSDDEIETLSTLIKNNWLSPLNDSYTSLLKFQEMVETTVDLSAVDQHEYIIKPDFNDELLQIKSNLDDLKKEINQSHLDVADDLNIDPEKKLKLENHHIHGYCFRVTRTDSSILRNKRQYIELSTVKAGVFFTTQNLKSISEQVKELQIEYELKQSTLVKQIIEIAATYCPVLHNLASLLAEIDVISSFAFVSTFAPIPYVRPKLHPMNSSDTKTIINEARHPCLEAQDDISFISNDVNLIKNESEFLIITGPNMGGKSTYIRTVGIISLMAQIGCFVSATKAELSIFDAILSRVGAGDSQLKGLSTFMSEMLEISSILKTATNNSLIIIDELGRGTSTYDGFGLAWGISEHIATNLHSFTLFATHFHELTSLADKVPTVKNLHVVADINEKKTSDDNNNSDKDEIFQRSEDITLLYKVEEGISDQSFGIHVAEIVKFPLKIISMAKRKASELEDYGSKKNGSKDDPYVADKRTKCNSVELIEGNSLLKTILKNWKAELKDNSKNLTNEEAVEKLRNLVNVKYEKQVKESKFLQEVLFL